MKTVKKYLSRFILCLVGISLVGFGAFYYGVNKGQQNKAPQITSQLISKRLQESAELTSSKYYYSHMGEFDHQKNFYGWKIPFTKKHFVVAYDGVIHAGVDLRQVEVTVNQNKKTIDLKLPEAKILSHDIDQHSLKVFDESQSIFNPIKITDYQGFAKDQKAKVEADAIEKGLLVQAKKDAVQAVKKLLHFNQNIESNYQIHIH